MATHCALLEIPPELRNIIYEYVALNEGTLLIKTRVRPEDGRCVAVSSSLVLANRQTSEEYIPVVQVVTSLPGTRLNVWVHDFNFRHLERYITSLRRDKPFTPEDDKVFEVHLTISAYDNINTERFASWLILDNYKGLDIGYKVKDAYSGHSFPVAPPLFGDLSNFRSCSYDSAHAKKIFDAVNQFQQRCRNRYYRLRSHDASKPDRYMK